MKNDEIPKSAKILIDNLLKKISCEDLRKLFKEYGEIMYIYFYYSNYFSNRKIALNKQKDHNSAEITFANWESAHNALIKNNSKFKSCQLSVHLLIEAKAKQDNLHNESDMSDNEGYDAFMNEYKQFYRDTKKSLKTRVQEIGINEVNVSEMLSQANNLYLSNQHDEAIKLLHEIIKQSPELQEPYQILSQIYEEKNDIKNALSFLMLAAQLSNGDKDIWIRCCNLNKQIKNYQQAEYCITRALKLEKKNIYILFERGSLNEEMGNLSKATRIYETLINYHPNLEILIYTSKIYEKLNRADKAIALIERNHLRLQKKLQAMLVLYELYLKNKQYEKGVYTYNSIKIRTEYNAIVLNDNFQIKRLLCYLYIKEKGPDELLIQYNEFSSSNSIIEEILKHFSMIINTIMSSEIYTLETEIDNLYHLFYLLENLNQIKRFIEIFNQIEKMLENTTEEMKIYFYSLSPDIYLKIADYFFQNKECNQAIDFFVKCLEIKNDDLIRVKLSEAYSLLGENNKAIEILQNKNSLKLNEDIAVNKENEVNNNEEYTISNYNSNNNRNEHEVSLSEIGNNSDGEQDGLYNFIKNQISADKEDDNNNSNNNDNEDSYAEFIDNELLKPFGNQKNDYMIIKTIDAPNFLSNDFNKYSSKKLIGRKRLRTTSKIKLLIDYNFDNYLHRKIRSRAYNSNNINHNNKNKLEILNSNLKRGRSYSLSSVVNTLNSLKNDFDELSSEVKLHKNLYLKLQESLLFIQSNNYDKFITNTFEPLKKILIQELKIEDYKTDLFNYILDKSLIKNYFHKKTSIFDQKEIENEEELPLIDALKPTNDREIEDKEIEEDKDEFLDKKNNLFVRKTTNKFLLAKKKIGKTIALVEKQLNDLENIEKYIQPENFFKIIEKFIEYAYEKENYKDVYVIITLLVNSRYFLQRNDYLSYNILLYAIMTSYKLKRYKTAFELSKRNISRYSFEDMPFFWMQFWIVEKRLSSRIARNYLYKFYFKKNISHNVHFQQMLATCYFHNGNLELAHHLFAKIVQTNKSPFILLLMGLSYIFQLLNRSMKIKKPNYFKALHFLNLYSIKRIKSNPYEVNYNLGRFFQFIGLDKEALVKYNELINLIDNSKHVPLTNEANAKIKQSCIYNMSMIIKKRGHEEEAHKLILDNIII